MTHSPEVLSFEEAQKLSLAAGKVLLQPRTPITTRELFAGRWSQLTTLADAVGQHATSLSTANGVSERLRWRTSLSPLSGRLTTTPVRRVIRQGQSVLSSRPTPAVETRFLNTQHLIIGLNRKDVDTILRGDVLTLPPGMPELSEASDIVVLFAETDKELAQRFPPALRPV
jgi:hypothetical protein